MSRSTTSEKRSLVHPKRNPRSPFPTVDSSTASTQEEKGFFFKRNFPMIMRLVIFGIIIILLVGVIILFIYFVVISYYDEGVLLWSPVSALWASGLSILMFLSLLGLKLMITSYKNYTRVSRILLVADFDFMLFFLICGLVACISYYISGNTEMGSILLIFWLGWPVLACVGIGYFLFVSIRNTKSFQLHVTFTKKEPSRDMFDHIGMSNSPYLLRQIIKHILFISFAVFVIAVAFFTLLFVYQAVGLSDDTLLYSPQGEMYVINVDANEKYAYIQNETYNVYPRDWKMHIFCVGEQKHPKDPVLIFETDHGEPGVSFRAVQNIVSQNLTAKVCTFDRSGYGFSQQGRMPRTLSQNVAELRQLLNHSNITGPLIFAGRGVGSTHARFFRYKYPELVKGILLLDGHPDDWYTCYQLSMTSQTNLMDRSRTLSVFGAYRLFLKGVKNFHPPEKSGENIMNYHTNENWNTKYFEYIHKVDNHNIIQHAKYDCPNHDKCFGKMPMLYVKAGNGVFNKTCEQLKYPPLSKQCKDQLKDNHCWGKFMGDFANMTSTFKLDVCMDCTDGMVWETPKVTAKYIIDFYKFAAHRNGTKTGT